MGLSGTGTDGTGTNRNGIGAGTDGIGSDGTRYWTGTGLGQAGQDRMGLESVTGSDRSGECDSDG